MNMSSDLGKSRAGAHTPTPWRQGIVFRYTDGRAPEHHPPADAYESMCVSTADMKFDIFTPNWGPATADAAFIVRACNAHDALVDAVTDLLRIARAATMHSGGETNRKRIAKAEAALAIATPPGVQS